MKLTKSQLKQIIKEEIKKPIDEKKALQENIQQFPGILHVLMSITSTEGMRGIAAKEVYNALTALGNGLEMTLDIYKEQEKEGVDTSKYQNLMGSLEDAKAQLLPLIKQARSKGAL